MNSFGHRKGGSPFCPGQVFILRYSIRPEEEFEIMSKKELLPVSVLILISGAMFSSHFGVGDLIFPPILGRDTGTSWFTASMGYAIINSIGVWLAYLACAHQNQSLSGIATKTLGNVFGKIYTAIPVLITVFFILPRVASATHEMAVLPLVSGSSPLAFSCCIFPS